MHFGATLRLLRIDAGLSLRDLASRIGVSSAYLSRVENGHDAAPTPDRLVAIADALELPRPLLVELARQTGPAVAGYVERVPEAAALLLEIARRNFSASEIARVKAFIDSELPERTLRRDATRLVDLLPAGRIVMRLTCSDIDDIVSIAAARLGHREPRTVVERLLAREHEAPTTLGGGFVAPHALIPNARDAAVLLTLARPVPLHTPDGKPVTVAVVVVTGSSAKLQLEMTARIARLASCDLAEELCKARTPRQVRSIIERVESLW
jgi:PTS system nitrogen regulatory IIA component